LREKIKKKKDKIKEKLDEQRKFYQSKIDSLKLQIVDKDMEAIEIKNAKLKARQMVEDFRHKTEVISSVISDKRLEEALENIN
jgi:hypothetical protein